MKCVEHWFVLLAGLWGLAMSGRLTAEVGAVNPDSERPYGIEMRIPWITSRILGSPEPPSPYLAERVFPMLKFNEPVDLCAPPGIERWFVAELKGKLFSFPNQPECDHSDLVVDLGREIK